MATFPDAPRAQPQTIVMRAGTAKTVARKSVTPG